MFKKLTNTQTKLSIHIEIESIFCKKETTQTLQIKFSRRELDETFSFIPNKPLKISFDFVGTFFTSNNGIIEKLLTIEIYELQRHNDAGTSQINLSQFALFPEKIQNLTKSILFNGMFYNINGTIVMTPCRDRSGSPLRMNKIGEEPKMIENPIRSPRNRQNGIIQNNAIQQQNVNSKNSNNLNNSKDNNSNNNNNNTKDTNGNENLRNKLTKVQSSDNLRQKVVLYKYDKDSKKKVQSAHVSEDEDETNNSNQNENEGNNEKGNEETNETRRNRFSAKRRSVSQSPAKPTSKETSRGRSREASKEYSKEREERRERIERLERKRQMIHRPKSMQMEDDNIDNLDNEQNETEKKQKHQSVGVETIETITEQNNEIENEVDSNSNSNENKNENEIKVDENKELTLQQEIKKVIEKEFLPEKPVEVIKEKENAKEIKKIPTPRRAQSPMIQRQNERSQSPELSTMTPQRPARGHSRVLSASATLAALRYDTMNTGDNGEKQVFGQRRMTRDFTVQSPIRSRDQSPMRNKSIPIDGCRQFELTPEIKTLFDDLEHIDRILSFEENKKLSFPLAFLVLYHTICNNDLLSNESISFMFEINAILDSIHKSDIVQTKIIYYLNSVIAWLEVFYLRKLSKERNERLTILYEKTRSILLETTQKIIVEMGKVIPNQIRKWLDKQYDFESIYNDIIKYAKYIESFHYPQPFYEELINEYMRLVDDEMMRIVGTSEKITEETGIYLQMIISFIQSEFSSKKIEIKLPLTKEISQIMFLQNKDVLGTDAIDEICPHLENQFVVAILRTLQKQRVNSINETTFMKITQMKRNILGIESKPSLLKIEIVHNILNNSGIHFVQILSLEEVIELFVDRNYLKQNSLFGCSNINNK